MTISDPNGNVVVDVDAEGRLKDWGLTELFSESNEPPFSEVPLAEFKARFPEGKYTFVGETIEGEQLVGTARLSHDIPDPPEITSPADGATVDRDGVVARWQAPPEPPGIDIVGYRVIATREDPLRVYQVELPASARKVPIPEAFLSRTPSTSSRSRRSKRAETGRLQRASSLLGSPPPPGGARRAAPPPPPPPLPPPPPSGRHFPSG